MSRNIEISIIIPLYNRANGIQRLLQKLSIQSFDMNHVEIIVSDDKSTDNSVDIVKSFANQLPNLTILKVKLIQVALQSQEIKHLILPKESGYSSSTQMIILQSILLLMR